MDATRLWRLEGVVQPYAWGSTTALPELLGRAPTGDPQAELWLGAHPRVAARVVGDGGESTPLDAWIRDDPRGVLGAGVAERFGGELPFLLKVLAVAAPLSIQAHPSPEQARAGFARENAAGVPLDAPERCYRDPNPKPELICALTRFRALCRFRAPAEIARRVDALGVAGLAPLLAPLRDAPDRDGLAAFFAGWLALDARTRAGLLDAAAASARRAAGADPALTELVRLADAYPGDAGVLAPLYLNLVELAPGEALFLPAGELHSYLEGTGVELMANSDNVLRGGLTPKHVDTAELLATLAFRSGDVAPLRPAAAGPAEGRYATPGAPFALSTLCLGAGASWQAPAEHGPEILLCTAGRVRLADARGRALDLARGQSAIAAAAAGAYRVDGEGVAQRAAVGA